jgi:hypothetical protein
VHQYGYTGQAPGPQGNNHPLLCPFGLFPVRDGFVSIACRRTVRAYYLVPIEKARLWAQENER